MAYKGIIPPMATILREPTMPEIVSRFLLFTLFHSLLAMETVKKLLRSNRPAGTRFYRPVYTILAAGSMVWLLAALPDTRILYALSGNPRVILLATQGCALLLLCTCAAQSGLGQFLGISQLLTGKECAPRFTRDGCYGKVRHPQYTLAVVLLLATPTMTVNHLIFTSLSAAYFILGSFLEESRLRELFGDDYRRYQQDVPMFVPNPPQKQERFS